MLIHHSSAGALNCSLRIMILAFSTQNYCFLSSLSLDHYESVFSILPSGCRFTTRVCLFAMEQCAHIDPPAVAKTPEHWRFTRYLMILVSFRLSN